MVYKHEIEGFEGFVELKILKYKERLQFLKRANINLDGKEVSLDSGLVDQIEKLEQIVKEQVTLVDLKHEKTGETFTTLEDLECYNVYPNLINELVNVVLYGAQLGN